MTKSTFGLIALALFIVYQGSRPVAVVKDNQDLLQRSTKMLAESKRISCLMKEKYGEKPCDEDVSSN